MSLVDLCLAASCNRDYALFETTHLTLKRTKTLVEGRDRCDFRLSQHAAKMGQP